ncbi:MAG: nucleotidyltransferase domain-containing protein [Myxococcota bacterium]
MSVTVEQAAAALRRRAAEDKARAQARAAALSARLPHARAVLTEKYGATRVLLFGSLASGDVHATSDVDIAVEGLQPVAYFDALSDLMDVFEVRVDLVRLETASPSLRERIEAEGQTL